MVTKKEKDETYYYSLINVTNGNILSGALNPLQWHLQHKKERHVRPRNFKISQFQTQDTSILEHFIENEKIDSNYSLGVFEIWVKEEDIDELYKALAISCLNNFCADWTKQGALIGAFLFHKDPTLFINEDFMGKSSVGLSYLRNHPIGKEFLTFLDSNNLLSYLKNKYSRSETDRCYFTLAELDLVKRQRKDIIVNFEYINEELIANKKAALEVLTEIKETLSLTEDEKVYLNECLSGSVYESSVNRLKMYLQNPGILKQEVKQQLEYKLRYNTI